MKRKEYEEKFDVDVMDDPETGETKVKDRTKDEVKLRRLHDKNGDIGPIIFSQIYLFLF